MSDQKWVAPASGSEAPTRLLYVGTQPRREAGIEALEDGDCAVEVYEADDTAAALDTVETRLVDCLVTQQALPDGTGVELCERVGGVAPEVRTVLTVEEGSEAVAAAALEAGVDGYIQGTAASDPEALREQVRAARTSVDEQTEALRTFRALQVASRELTVADSLEAICESAVSIARDVLGLPLSGIHLASGDRLEPVAISAAVEETFGEPPTYTPDDEFVWSAFERGESERFESPDGLEGADTPVESGMVLPLGDHGVHIVTATEPRAVSETDRFFAELLASTTTAALDRVAATERLREERDRFARLFESVPDPAVEYRFEDGQPVVEAVNDAFEAVFGYEESDVRGRAVDTLLVPEDERGAAQEINEAAADGRRIQREVDRLTTDGRQSFLLRNAPWDDGNGGYALYVDISDRKERERTITALHGATRRLVRADSVPSIGRTVVETTRDVVGLPYSAAFRYDESADKLDAVAVTAEALEMAGRPPSFAPGEGIVGTVFERGERLVLDDTQRDERAPASGSEAIRSYCALPLGSHGVVTIGAPTVGEFDDTTVEFVELLAANATTALDRLEREQELKEREERLRQQNERLEAFASVVSHDLRNPLTVLEGCLDLASETGDPEYFEDARAAVERMESLIDDLLVLARQGQTVDDPVPTGVHTVAEDAWAEVPTGNGSLAVEGKLVTRADPDRLRQLFANLFRNAIEHAGEQDPPSVEVGVLDDGVGFYVADDGPGIPEDQREQVFEHGFTTSSEGTGLGLKIVADVAAAHDWAVATTESRWGGARFEFRGVEDASYDEF